MPISPTRRPHYLYIFICILILLSISSLSQYPVQASSNGVVISQVYGGGGESGAPYKNDYVELFNAGTSSVSLNGWSAQYTTATGTNGSWVTINLPNVVLQSGQYFLIQLAGTGSSGLSLPIPDITWASGINNTDAKIALVNSTVSLTGKTPQTDSNPSIIDFVGYGNVTDYENTAAPALSITTAGFRADAGCTDTDNNSLNFTTGTPAPRNTSTLLNPCGGFADDPPSVSNTTPTADAVDVAVDSNIAITFSEDVVIQTGWFSISCTTSGTVNAAVSGSDANYTLNPSVNLAYGEVCEVTVIADLVKDEDGVAQTMSANYSWSFSTDEDAPPYVAATNPANSAANIAINANIAVNFSENVTVTGDWYSISCSESGLVSAVVSGGPQIFTLNPSADFAYEENCTVTIIAAQIADQDDTIVNMAQDYVWGFIVAPLNVDDPPQVSTTLPAANAVDVPLNTNITVNFSEDVDVDGSWFTIVCTESNTHSAAVTGGTQNYILDPLTDFVNDETCTITIYASNVSDVDGTPQLMISSYFWSFTTVAGEGDAPPSVLSTSPENGATNVAVDTNIGITFSKTVTFSDGWYSIICGTTSLSAQLSGGFTEFVLDPITDFQFNESCLVTIYADKVKDLGSLQQAMSVDYIFSFATDAGTIENFPPQVSSISPAANASGVPLNADIQITFNEDVSVTGTWYLLSCTSSGDHPASVIGGPRSFTLNSNADFAHSETCTVTLHAAQITDLDAESKNLAADYIWTFTTAPEPGVCDDPFTPIYTIQGSDDVTSLSGVVVTEGIVTANFVGAAPLLGGFYIQAADGGDGDGQTSDGIFVYRPNEDSVTVGRRVRVIGTVIESFGQTEISDVQDVIDCGVSGTVLPLTLSLPVEADSTLERYEGMLVTYAQTLTVTDTYTLGRYGEVWLSSGGRLYAPTQITSPGASAVAQEELNQRNRILLDDLSNAVFPDPTPYLWDASTLRLGDTVTGLTGIMSYDYSNYRLHPTISPTFTRSTPRLTVPPILNGTLKVASFNVLNYFNGPSFPTSRGADTLTEFTRQREKLISAIVALDADIIGLIEIENDGYGADSALQDLVNGLNEATASGTYAFIAPDFALGTDEIKVALVYRPAKVRTSGSPSTTTAAPFNIRRPPLAQTFEEIATGEQFTVVITHLKSRTCTDSGGLNADQGDGQGCWNAERTEAANTLQSWLATDPTNSDDPDILIIGDFNAYALENPITAITGAGYKNLAAAFNLADAYSYNFDGQSGTLDYALASEALFSQVTGTAIWHINADEPEFLDYNLENKSVAQAGLNTGTVYRSSDHDPVVVSLSLGEIDNPIYSATLELIAPLGIIEIGYGNPVYQWTRLENATAYQLYLAPQVAIELPVFHEFVTSSDVCSADTCTLDATLLNENYRLMNGAYVMYLRAWNNSTPGGWAGPFEFTLDAVPPAPVTLTEAERIVVSRPRFNALLAGEAAYASWFNFKLIDSANVDVPLVDQWMPRSQACGSISSINCLFETPFDLVNGRYGVQILSWGPGGFSPEPAQLTVNLSAFPPQIPVETTVNVNQGRPTVTWADDANASWYQLSMTSPEGESLYDTWHYRDVNLCAESICRLNPDVNPLNGDYVLTLRAWGAGGLTDWSFPVNFHVEFAAPSVVVNLTTTEPDGGKPTFSWQGVPGGTWYQIWVGTPAFETYYMGWHLGADMGCMEPVACNLHPPLELPNNNFIWYVQVWGPGGFSTGGIEGWAVGLPFIVDALPPGIPTPATPQDVIYNESPTFTWQPLPDVTWYEISIENAATLEILYSGWHSATTLNCTSEIGCQLNVPGLLLPNNNYRWSLRAYTPAGVGVWSSGQAFSVLR